MAENQYDIERMGAMIHACAGVTNEKLRELQVAALVREVEQLKADKGVLIEFCKVVKEVRELDADSGSWAQEQAINARAEQTWVAVDFLLAVEA